MTLSFGHPLCTVVCLFDLRFGKSQHWHCLSSHVCLVHHVVCLVDMGFGHFGPLANSLIIQCSEQGQPWCKAPTTFQSDPMGLSE